MMMLIDIAPMWLKSMAIENPNNFHEQFVKTNPLKYKSQDLNGSGHIRICVLIVR